MSEELREDLRIGKVEVDEEISVEVSRMDPYEQRIELPEPVSGAAPAASSMVT
jgi:hypothetical protein